MTSSQAHHSDSPHRISDFKALYRKLEGALDRIERIENLSLMLSDILQMLISEFREDLGFEGGRLYKREGEDYVLCNAFGKSSHAPIGYRVPRDYVPHRRTLEQGLMIVRPDDPTFDAAIETIIGVSSTFAAIAVGEGNTHVLAFSVNGEVPEDQILYSLSAVRHVINLKLNEQRLTGMLQESKIIQESLLPPSAPEFAGYDIFGRSRSTEIVGGDLFDFLPLGSDLLGVAIGDASGHGLPAALLARDVITGLRVGMDEDLKVIRVVDRLNRVIHRAALSSRFISLFYGEFGKDGSLIYCNAGHNPPLLRRLLREEDGRLAAGSSGAAETSGAAGSSGSAGSSGAAVAPDLSRPSVHSPRCTFRELDRGGLVLGPNPQAHYERGYVHLEPGDTVIMFTDGITERENRKRVDFGLERLRKLLRETTEASSRDIVEMIFDAVEEHAGGIPSSDDMTVVVVRKL